MESVELTHLLNEFRIIREKLDSLQSMVLPPKKEEYRSATLNELFTALAKAQAEMDVACKDVVNPYFKLRYADFTSLVTASRPALTKNGLAVIQQIIPHEDGVTMLHTILTHTSGQWIESRMRVIPNKSDIQALGSYITYLKRYAYAALIGVVANDQEDDDGEKDVAETRQLAAKGTALNMQYEQPKNSYDTITKEQLDLLEHELSDHPDIAKQVLDGLRLQNLADMPKDKFKISISRIREIKQARNGK